MVVSSQGNHTCTRNGSIHFTSPALQRTARRSPYTNATSTISPNITGKVSVLTLRIIVTSLEIKSLRARWFGDARTNTRGVQIFEVVKVFRTQHLFSTNRGYVTSKDRHGKPFYSCISCGFGFVVGHNEARKLAILSNLFPYLAISGQGISGIPKFSPFKSLMKSIWRVRLVLSSQHTSSLAGYHSSQALSTTVRANNSSHSRI